MLLRDCGLAERTDTTSYTSPLNCFLCLYWYQKYKPLSDHRDEFYERYRTSVTATLSDTDLGSLRTQSEQFESIHE